MSSTVPVSIAITPRESLASNVNDGIEPEQVIQALVRKLEDFSAVKNLLTKSIIDLQCRSSNDGIGHSSELESLNTQLINCWKDVINYIKDLSEDVKEGGLCRKLPLNVLGIYCLVKNDYCLPHLDGKCLGRDFCGKTHLDPIPKCINF